MLPILLTILSSSVKFAMTFPIAIMTFRFNFFETLLWTNLGGLAGIYFFAFLSDKLIGWWKRTFRPNADTGKKRDRKIFTRRNRQIIRIKQRYGLIGIAAATPFLLSIPVGTFLVVRYYRNVRSKLVFLVSANLVWSVIYTSFYMLWDGILFNRA